MIHRYAEGDPDLPVLVLLHGTGGGPDDLLSVANELSPESGTLAPAGPVSENGAARWFRRLSEGVFDHEDVRARADELADFLNEAREKYGFGRAVAVGFSNGANIAAAVALTRPDALREAILFSSMSPLPELPRLDLTGTRIFLSNGEQDPMAPLPANDALVRQFRERHAEVATHRWPGGHQVTVEGISTAKDWLARVGA
ncbi:alpha/beta hydrolase [Amycolatopsis dendrobii]|uniref:Alpha/beta hydrolase n=1 Tax=Amycolatopsis dendrobii TaxID=2760662 RepID=A0A7W3ZG66_9PSEU|nr:alpha/beta hydrolase [Amycolatopsis dendrobii]MBB1159764.1 alpha/beta hydrolase [Amycolatopsis dendrobii]